jgi:hypothetical protein
MTVRKTTPEAASPISLEELARRMLAMPHKDRARLVKKKQKPRRKK